MCNFTKRLLLLVLMLMPLVAMSQTMVSQYAMEAGIDAGKWVTLPAGSTTNLITNGGNYSTSALTNIGFEFVFGGVSYTQFSVNADGNLKLGSPATSSSGASQPFGLNNVSVNVPKMNAFGCNGNMEGGGYAKCAVMGTAPNRKLVVEYKTGENSFWSSTADIKWQVQLFEGSNEIMFVYASEAPEEAPDGFQIGMASSSTDVLTVNTGSGSVSTGATGVEQTRWPSVNTYYRFYEPTCFRPTNLTIGSLVGDVVNFSWSASEGQSSWQYMCVLSGATADWSMATTTGSTSGSVSGLLPNSDYELLVRTVCSGGDYSDAVMAEFHTGCVPMGVPFVEDFEGYEEYDMPDCWVSHNLGSSIAFTDPSWVTAHAGEAGLMVGIRDTIVAPMIKLPLNQLTMSAWIMSEDISAGSLIVGYASDATTVANFVPVRTITPLHNAFEEYVIDFSSTGVTDTCYVVFKHTTDEPDAWYSFYLDDVKFDRSSSCPRLGYAYVRNVTHDGATIVWEVNPEVMGVEVAYGVTDTLANATRVEPSMGEDTLRLENLLNNTEYYAWVRNICDEDSSAWYALGSFRTMRSCARVKDLRVAYLGTTSASVCWEMDDRYGEDATAVEFSYKKMIDSVWSSPVTLTNQHYYILSNLESGFTYEVRVKTRCGAEASDDATTMFTTMTCGTEVAGDGVEFTHYVPFSGMYYYCYSQMLYPASLLTGLDTIKGIAVDVDDVASVQTRVVDVYLQNVSSSELSLAHPLNMGSMTKVATDATVVLNEGWVSMMFDTPFVYDGSSNVGVVISDHTGRGGDFVYVCTNNLGKTLYKRSDYEILSDDATNVASLEAISKMADMRFISDCPAEVCETPVVAFEDITDNSITIHWSAGTEATQWEVGYKEVEASVWTTQMVGANDYTIDNLQPGTRYDIRVGVACGTEMVYATVVAMTDCLAMTTPFEEDFDDEVLECWTMGTTGQAEVVWTDEGDNGKLSYGDYGGGYVITPAIEATMNELQIFFKLGSNSTYGDGAMVVSVGDSPDNLASFISIDTLTVAMESPMALQMVSLEHYAGSGHYIMFSSFSGYVYLDEVRIDVAPECSMPTELVASNVTGDGATITWRDNGSSVNKWLVSYCKVGERMPMVYEVDFETGATHSHTVSGLEANTEYRVSVATVCSTDDTTETLYPITFWTECVTVEVPYFEGFEGIDAGLYHNCWYRQEPSVTYNRSLQFQGILVPSVYIGEGDGNTMIVSDNKTFASTLIPLPANQLSVNFDMRVQEGQYSGDLVVGFTTNPTDYSAMVAVDTLDIDVEGWHNYTVDFNNIGSTDTGYVVFKNINNRYSGTGWNLKYYYIWLDNINFSKYSTCARPSGGSVDNITANTADVTMNAAGNYTIAWNTKMRLNDAQTMDITTATAQITNLQSSTQYYAWVRKNCGETSHSAWVLLGAFKTECASMTLPYIEDFEDYYDGIATNATRPSSYPNHTLPECWEIIGMSRTGSAPVPMISNYPAFVTSGNGLYVEGSSSKKLYMVLPKIEPSIDSLLLTFDYRLNIPHDIADEFVLGVMTDPTDTATFVTVEELPNVSEKITVDHAFVYDESLAPNTNYYIAFRFGGMGSNQSLGMDNVRVEYAPSCVHPIELAITHVGMNSVDATWRGLSNSYEVAYRVEGATDWSVVNAATERVSIATLMSGSSYEMKVRGICGVGDTSGWSKIEKFNTICGAVELPFVEDFDSYTEDVTGNTERPDSYPNHFMPDCWMFAPMSAVFNGTPAAWLTVEPNDNRIQYNSIEGVSLRLYSDTEEHMYAVLPAMNGPMDTLMLKFDYARSRYSAALMMGVMTDPYDYSTFEPLQRCAIYDSIVSVEHYFMFDDLDSTETYYIAFDAGKSNGKITTLDNIVVDYMPSCIRPGNVVNYATFHNQTGVKWLTTSTSAEVKYRMTASPRWIDTVVDADTIVIRNLMSSTDYEVMVRSICGEGDSSEWSDTLRFSTECDPYALPYSEDFENIGTMEDLSCWAFYRGLVDEVMDGSVTWHRVSPGTSQWKPNTTTEISSLKVYLNLFDNNRNDWMVTPQLSIVSNAVLSFKVAFSCYYEPTPATDFSDDKFYVMATTDNGTTWTKLVTWGPDAEDTYPMDSLHVAADSIVVSLDEFVGEKVRIAFYAESSVDNGDNKLFVGDVMVDGAPCVAPTDVEAIPDALSAVLSWSGSSQHYEVDIRENSSFVWSEPIAVDGLTYTFTGLLPNTMYVYRVRTVCAEGAYSSNVEGVFTTLDYPCGKPVVSVTGVHGNGATFTWSTGEHNTSWEVNVFNAMMNESYDVSATDYTIEGLAPATEYYVSVRSQCVENVYSEWSDTVAFTTEDCSPVTGVTANDITSNSAVITWTPGGNETRWIINYGEYGFSQGQGEFDTITVTTYAITGLESDSDYDVYVRAMCGDNFTSAWSTPVCQFQTLVAGGEGIDGIDGDFQFGIYPNPTSGATTISLTGVEGKVTISVVDMNGRVVNSESMECGSDCEKLMDVTGLAQGTYFVRVVGDEINSVRKLIVR